MVCSARLSNQCIYRLELIGTIVPSSLDISFALTTLSPVLIENDYIKSFSSFSTYYSGFGWYGGITSIDRNNMYKLKVSQ